MDKSKSIPGLKTGGDFSSAQRKAIVEEYLLTGCSKHGIWKKYTGQEKEHGQLINWMRNLGHDIPKKSGSLGLTKKQEMLGPKIPDTLEVAQLRDRIAELEKALISSELRATAYETMVEVAEKELKISIRKKSFTKQSI